MKYIVKDKTDFQYGTYMDLDSVKEMIKELEKGDKLTGNYFPDYYRIIKCNDLKPQHTGKIEFWFDDNNSCQLIPGDLHNLTQGEVDDLVNVILIFRLNMEKQ